MSESAVLRESIPMPAAQVAIKPILLKTSAISGSFDGARWHEALDAPNLAREATPLDPLASVGSSELIRQQVGRILGSSLFVQSERLSRFLKFVVEHAIEGNQKHIKEYVIGCEVYDRKPPYNPSIDSIVRTEARRLRSKLNEYYLNAGRDDSVRISFRQGCYVPVFQSKRSNHERLPESQKLPACVAILSFNDISGSSLSSRCARGISEELSVRLLADHGCRIISLAPDAHLANQEHDVGGSMSKVNAQIAFGGSVQEEDNHIRVIARIVNQAGIYLWATRFDADAAKLPMFAIEDQITAALSAGYNSLYPAPACDMRTDSSRADNDRFVKPGI